MKTHARVVVIGGGIGGCSTLYHLTKEGWDDVVLVERDELTSGSTWHAAAQVTQFGAVQVMVGLKRYSTRLYAELAADPDFPITYHITGGIRLAHTQDHIDGYNHFIGMAKGMGVDFELLPADECGRRHPLMKPDGLMGALWDPVDGDIDPSGLTQALARGARNAGAEVYRFNPVEAIDRKANGEWVVHTKDGDITCDKIVNATGYRVNEVGAMIGVTHPVMSMEHQYFVTEEIPELAAMDRRVPIIRDPGDDFYSRQERTGLLVGIYEQGCKTWGLDGISPDFTMSLCPDDLDRLLDNMDRVFQRLPVLAETGIKRNINGPITYSADGLPLIGKIPGVENAYACLGLRAGIGEGGGHGKLLAEIIVHGEAEWDTWALDPRRFTGHADIEYTTAIAIEDYQNEFRFHMPDEHRPAGRPAKTTPLTPVLEEARAEFGVINGWERALYYRPDDPAFRHLPSFRHTTWFDVVAAECKAVRERVGVMEISGFTRFELAGPDAAAYLDRLSTNRLPKVGRVGLAYFCNERGHVVGEATVNRLAVDRFWLLSAAPAEYHDWDWLNQNLAGEDVTLTNLTASHQCLAVAGPRSRELLARLTDADLSNRAFPWLSAQTVDVGPCEAEVMRVGFTGELAWEIHMPAGHERAVYDRVVAAGADLGLVHFGSLANEAMRLEKCYRHWKADLITERTPLETCLERFVRFDKGEFIGRAALLQQKQEGVGSRFVPMVIDCDIASARAGDPIYDGDRLLGAVTSAGYGFTVDKNIAMGFLPVDRAEAGTKLEIQIIGTRYPATVVAEPIFDPANERPRA
ncbi:MAG: FAD-dependent oxidoreductase [Pseudomonadota bacterium]